MSVTAEPTALAQVLHTSWASQLPALLGLGLGLLDLGRTKTWVEKLMAPLRGHGCTRDVKYGGSLPGKPGRISVKPKMFSPGSLCLMSWWVYAKLKFYVKIPDGWKQSDMM